MKLIMLVENIRERDVILAKLDSVPEWYVYRTYDFEGKLAQYVPVADFLKRLNGVSTYKEFKTLPYSLQAIRDNYSFLIMSHHTIPGEAQAYTDKLLHEFILGNSIDIDAMATDPEFHSDDDFGHSDAFVWFDDQYVYKGRPYNLPEKLGRTPPTLLNQLNTMRNTIKDFITKPLS